MPHHLTPEKGRLWGKPGFFENPSPVGYGRLGSGTQACRQKARKWRSNSAWSLAEDSVRREYNSLPNRGHTFPVVTVKTRVSVTMPNSGGSLFCPSASLSYGLGCAVSPHCYFFLSMSFRTEARSRTNQVQSKVLLGYQAPCKGRDFIGTSSLEVTVCLPK